MRRLPGIRGCLLALVLLIGSPALADEGMWTFQNLPAEKLKKRYGFTPDQGWLDHVRLASVRFNNGGSGSIVSARGLVLTNHHVVSDQVAKLSEKERDLEATGFLARTEADELRCPDLELNVLIQMIDVTRRVKGAVKPGASPGEASRQRQAEIARIEQESAAETGLRSNVVRLYAGAEYWLYRYKK